MTYSAEIGDAASQLYRQGVVDSLGGDYVQSGCGVSIGNSSTDIVIQVDAGTVYIDNNEVSVQSQPAPLDPGDDSQHRFDTLYITPDGSVDVAKGTSVDAGAAAPQTSDGSLFPARKLWNPAPPPIPDTTGPPIAAVFVPAGASDSTDLSSSDWIDYQIPGVDTSAFARINDNGDIADGDGGVAVVENDPVTDLDTSPLDSQYAAASTTPELIDPADITENVASDSQTAHAVGIEMGDYLESGADLLNFDLTISGARNFSGGYDTHLQIKANCTITQSQGGANATFHETFSQNNSGAFATSISSTDTFEFQFDTTTDINAWFAQAEFTARR